MKIKVVDIGVRSRWQGMVLTLEDWTYFDNFSIGMSRDDYEDLKFDTFDNQGFYYNPELHELVDV